MLPPSSFWSIASFSAWISTPTNGLTWPSLRRSTSSLLAPSVCRPSSPVFFFGRIINAGEPLSSPPEWRSHSSSTCIPGSSRFVTLYVRLITSHPGIPCFRYRPSFFLPSKFLALMSGYGSFAPFRRPPRALLPNPSFFVQSSRSACQLLVSSYFHHRS